MEICQGMKIGDSTAYILKAMTRGKRNWRYRRGRGDNPGGKILKQIKAMYQKAEGEALPFDKRRDLCRSHRGKR